jgi:hypothetical protein
LSNNSNAATILNGIVQPPDTLLNIFEYDKSIEDYRIARQLRPGVAYFYRPEPLNPDGTRTIYLRGARPVSNQAPLSDPNQFGQELATPFQYTLNRGWNLIGNPYVYDIPLAFLRFVPLESNPTLQAFSYTEAVSNNFVRGAVFFYAGNGNYDFLTDIGAPLRPWVGYWIFVNQPVTLIFSAPGQLNTAILPAPITNRIPIRSRPRASGVRAIWLRGTPWSGGPR